MLKFISRLRGKKSSAIYARISFGFGGKMDKFKDNQFFRAYEFDSVDAPGSGNEIDTGFLKWLTIVRLYVNRPFKITSGYRTKEHNLKLIESGYPASPDSSHLKGLACDIWCPDNSFRCEVIRYALKYGINRIGVARSFIHLDTDREKPQNMIWVY